MFATVAGCGSSSTDSESDDSTSDSDDSTSDSDDSTVESSTVTCSQDALCKGTYSTNVVTGEGSLNGPCNVSYVDGGQTVKIVFVKSDTCDFNWVKAEGETGTYWLNLVNVNKKLTVHHKGEDVYLLRAFK
jgi:hypothetical protein